MTCPAGQTISVIKADFGRDTNSMTCDSQYHSGNECSSRTATTTKVRDLCQDKLTCNLTASTAELGDPCPTVIKQLRVWYQCVPSPSNFII